MEQEIVSITTSFNKSGCSLLEAAMQIYVEETIFNMYMTYILKPQDFEDVWIYNCDYDNIDRCEGEHHFEHYEHSEPSYEHHDEHTEEDEDDSDDDSNDDE